MKLENRTICNNCEGIYKCNKMCIIHCGKALVDFISRVDVTETRIGEYESTKKGGPLDLVVSGHQLYDFENPSWVLTGINTTLDASDKFTQAYDKNAFQIASLFCKNANMTVEETQKITNKIRDINKNKLFVLPFKTHTKCNVDIDTDEGILKKQDAQISLIKWTTNKDTHKINCKIVFELEELHKTASIDIKDYIDKFRLSQMDIQAKSKNHDKRLIKINDYGIFKPIYVSDGASSVAIDGTYMYYIINGETYIIGYWDEYNKMNVITNIKTKAFNKIMDNIEDIKHHKRYMAPYLLIETNKITV